MENLTYSNFHGQTVTEKKKKPVSRNLNCGRLFPKYGKFELQDLEIFKKNRKLINPKML